MKDVFSYLRNYCFKKVKLAIQFARSSFISGYSMNNDLKKIRRMIISYSKFKNCS